MFKYLHFFLILFASVCVLSQTDGEPLFQSKYKEFWFDKNGRPLIELENALNGPNRTEMENQNRSISNLNNSANNNRNNGNQNSGNNNQNNSSENSIDPTYILTTLFSNSSRTFKLLDYKIKNYGLSSRYTKQSIKVSLRFKKNIIEILKKNPLKFDFALDQSNNNPYNKCEVIFTNENKKLAIEFILFKNGKGFLREKKEINLEEDPQDNGKKIILKINLANKENAFLVNIYEDNIENIPHSLTSSDIDEEIKEDNYLSIENTQINQIFINFEGDDKSKIGLDCKIYEDSKCSVKKISRRKAILIANDYSESDNLNLDGHPTGDADELAKIMASTDRLWDIQKLYNKSKDSLKNYFLNVDNFSNFDTLFIFYAGHGVSGNFGKDDEKIWKDYWVPNDFKEGLGIFNNSKSEESLNNILNKLYSINELLIDVNNVYHKLINDEKRFKDVKLVIISDACRDDITRTRTLIPPNRKTNEVKFDFLFLPVVAPGDVASNKNSWTRKNLIESTEFRKRSFAGLPEIKDATPWDNTDRNGTDTKPFTEIYLLK
jgi:hypothetical protein